jgi:hypothetical protein
LVVDFLLLAAILLFRVVTAVLRLKPTSAFRYAVFLNMTKLPVWLLSVKPFAALEKEMQLLILWFAAALSAASPPPSLKPLPSPWKSVNDQRLTPLPQEMVSIIVTLDLNSL